MVFTIEKAIRRYGSLLILQRGEEQGAFLQPIGGDPNRAVCAAGTYETGDGRRRCAGAGSAESCDLQTGNGNGRGSGCLSVGTLCKKGR